MPAFSKSSFTQLSTCHPDLQTLFFEVIKYFDCIVLEGFRGKEKQDEAFNAGNSKLKWPNGKHNQMPSFAVDVAPFSPKLSVDWSDVKRMYYFAGQVMAIARQLKDAGKMTHGIIYGGDWNNNTEVSDQTFNDLVHFELIP
jgi:peptidoglycan LD-endopeptidase CwlK